MIEGLAVFGPGIAAGRPLHGPFELLLGFPIHSPFQEEDAQGDVRPVIAGVAPQGFFIIRIGFQGRIIKLLQAQSGQIELLDGGDVLGRSGRNHGRRQGGLVDPHGGIAHKLPAFGGDERQGKRAGVDALGNGHLPHEGTIRTEGSLLLINRADADGQDGPGVGIIAGRVEPQPGLPAVGDRQLAGRILRCRLDSARPPQRVPPLFHRARLERPRPAVVGLVVRERSEHQLGVGAVRVGQDLLPKRAVRAGPPRPELLARNEVVIGDETDARVLAVIVAGQEVALSVESEERSRPDVALPPGDIDAGPVILAVEDLLGDRPMAELVLAMERGQRRIRREDDLVIRIGADRGVGEAEHGLGQRRAVENPDGHLHGRGIGPQGQADDPFRPVAQFDLPHPDGGASVRPVDDQVVHGQEGRGPMVMGHVPLHSARDPGPQHADERRFDDVLAIDEIVAVGLVLGGKKAAADFRQDAQLEILVFQVDGLIGLVLLDVAQPVQKGVGIDGPLGALVGPAGIKHGIGLGRLDEVGGDDQRLLPDPGSRLGRCTRGESSHQSESDQGADRFRHGPAPSFRGTAPRLQPRLCFRRRRIHRRTRITARAMTRMIRTRAP